MPFTVKYRIYTSHDHSEYLPLDEVEIEATKILSKNPTSFILKTADDRVLKVIPKKVSRCSEQIIANGLIALDQSCPHLVQIYATGCVAEDVVLRGKKRFKADMSALLMKHYKPFNVAFSRDIRKDYFAVYDNLALFVKHMLLAARFLIKYLNQVHLDIKLANVMIDYFDNGDVCYILGDFGLMEDTTCAVFSPAHYSNQPYFIWPNERIPLTNLPAYSLGVECINLLTTRFDYYNPEFRKYLDAIRDTCEHGVYILARKLFTGDYSVDEMLTYMGVDGESGTD